MTEEDKLKRGAEIRAAMEAEKEKVAKMTLEERDKYYESITDDGICAASLEEQEKLGE